ncbi:MAG: AAA family ATPase [Lewinellaceae bacterium]|nr:AAA family ATPase [Lewinellaceae bacterium]
MQTHEAFFQKLHDLIQLEKEEDLEQYRALVERLPMAERKAKGFTWYPVLVGKSGYTYGERAYVIVEHQEAPDFSHQFRSGKTVRFFVQLSDGKTKERTGVINFIDKKRMKIVLNTKDLPEWMHTGQAGVDLQFDERTYQEMEKALKIVREAKKGRLAELRAVFMGKQERLLAPIPKPVQLAELNDSQNQALNQILAAQDVAVVHGPPGTGKTTTLVHAIRLLCERESTVLVTAPSNTATDLLTERLAEMDLNVVRVGNISRVDESIISHTLEAQLSKHPESKNIKKVKIQAAEYRRQAKRFRRTFGREEYNERKDLYQQAGELDAWAKDLEDRLIDQILTAAQVITCTLVGAAHPVLEGRKFRTVVIDEAAQALEPASWIPIIRASKVVLAGDPHQLPPTVKSMKAQREGLDVTLIERCIAQWEDVSLLTVQYRMHNAIMGFSNEIFYKGLLRAAEEIHDHRLLFGGHEPVTFIDTAGCGFEELVTGEYQSRYNPQEFQILCEHLYQLVESYGDHPLPSIALISPYREQVVYMESIVREDALLASLPLTINTIDGFQGQERDVVYISLVRSNSKGQIGFLSDYRRMNVAMTRARKLLVVVGDSATIANHDFYQAFLDYVDREGHYQTAWEFML